MGWVTDQAPTRDELNSCVQCGLCLPACPTFRLTGRETESPRGRLMAMDAVSQGIIDVDQAFANVMESCLQCRACERVCPSMVPFGRAMEGARAELSEQLPSRQRTLRHLGVGKALEYPALLRFAAVVGSLIREAGLLNLVPSSLVPVLRGLRSPQRRGSVKGMTAEATNPVGTVALLSGCVMDTWFSDVHHASIGLLRMAGYNVEVPESQTCCGALAAHDGDGENTRRMAVQNVGAFEGVDFIVADSAGCGAHLKDYQHWADGGQGVADRTRDITELVADAIASGRLPQLALGGETVAVQDPCHLQNAQKITEQPRTILRAAGYLTVDVDPDNMCCGAAGTYSVLHPEKAEQLGAAKRDQIIATGTQLVASANPGCDMQLRGYLERSYRVAHPVELYWEAIQSSVD